MARHAVPNVPFVEAFYQGKKHKPTAIVVRMTNLGSAAGSALAVANNCRRSHIFSPDVPHYAVDSEFVYNCVPPDHSVDYDRKALVVMVCIDLSQEAGDGVLYRTAELVAALGLRYGIKLRHIDGEELSKWERFRSKRRGGIYVEDPRGLWPAEKFERYLLNVLDRS